MRRQPKLVATYYELVYAVRAYGKNIKDALKSKKPRGTKEVDVLADTGEVGNTVNSASKLQRSDHKFQRKPQKHAGINARVLAKAGISPYGTFESSEAQNHVHTGKRGGIVRL